MELGLLLINVYNDNMHLEKDRHKILFSVGGILSYNNTGNL